MKTKIELLQKFLAERCREAIQGLDKNDIKIIREIIKDLKDYDKIKKEMNK